MRYDEIRWRAEMIRYEYEAKIWYGKMVVFRIQAICTDCHIGIRLCSGSYPVLSRMRTSPTNWSKWCAQKKGRPWDSHWEWGWPQCKRPVVFAIIRCACHCSAQCAQTIQNSSWYIWPTFLVNFALDEMVTKWGRLCNRSGPMVVCVCV